MTSKARIRRATPRDTEAIRRLASKYSDDLGYVSVPQIRDAINKREAIVVEKQGEIIGFALFHKTRLGITTLYDICVDEQHRGQGHGRAMIEWLKNNGYKNIQLKCPTSLPANKFYQKLGFKLHKTEPGKKRPLNIWRSF